VPWNVTTPNLAAVPTRWTATCEAKAPIWSTTPTGTGPALRVGTSLTEGTANFLVNRRMAKSQQMRWSRRGADLLLQVRCAIYNGALGPGLGHLFEPAPSQPHPSLAEAA